MHRSDDVCLAQELVRDELPRSNSDSNCDATVGNCGGFGHAPHVTNSPLGVALHTDHSRRKGLPFSVCSALLWLWRWRRRSPAEKAAPGLGDTKCHRRPCTLAPPSLRFSATRAAGLWMTYERRHLDHTAHSGDAPWAGVSVEAVLWISSLLAVAGLAGLLVPQWNSRYAGSERSS